MIHLAENNPKKIFRRAFAVWLLMAVIAVMNGAIRVAFIIPQVGEHAAQQISTATGCAVLFLAMWLLVPWIGPQRRKHLWQIGFFWLSLTVAFEFIAGHYLFGNPWEKLLANYNIFRGRVWVAVLLLLLFGPLWAARLRGLRLN